MGESGCGKSTLGLALAGLLPENATVTGNIRLGGRELVGLDERELRRFRGAEVGIVFQDPMTSLNPTKRIGAQVGEALRLQRGRQQSRGAPGGVGDVGPGRPAPSRRSDRPVPPRAFRRDAPAGCHRLAL